MGHYTPLDQQEVEDNDQGSCGENQEQAID